MLLKKFLKEKKFDNSIENPHDKYSQCGKQKYLNIHLDGSIWSVFNRAYRRDFYQQENPARNHPNDAERKYAKKISFGLGREHGSVVREGKLYIFLYME